MERPLTAPAASARPTSPRVLIVEDDRHLANVVERYLAREGFEVEVVHDGEAGLQRALEWLPDLVVLDLMLPRRDGLQVFRRLRRVAPIPVVMLTARGSEEDRVAGLELGADDYVAKPFSPRELTARVRAVLRRAAGPVDDRGASILRAGDLEVDLVAHEAVLVLSASVATSAGWSLGRRIDAGLSAIGEQVGALDGDECGGIPTEDLHRILDVAFRGDLARSRDTGGGGLGLAIARGLLEARAGRISVRNRLGGCEFTVHVPAAVRP